MGKNGDKMRRFGLIGRNIGYSFSRGYFSEKFQQLGLENHSYENFDLEDPAQIPYLLRHTQDLAGLNVTIPYKQAVVPLLDRLVTLDGPQKPASA